MLNATAHATAAQLYAQAGTDFSALSWFETQWANWYIWVGNPILATGILSFLMHEVRVSSVVFASKCVFVFSSSNSLRLNVCRFSLPFLRIDCLLWAMCAMDDHRPDAIL